MKKVSLLFLTLLLSSLVSAIDIDSGINVTIVNGTLTIKDYITPFGTVITGTNAVFDSFTQNIGTSIVCVNPFVDVNGTNLTYYKQGDCHTEISFYKDIPLKKNFINSTSNCTTSDFYVVSAAIQKELDVCKTDKAIIQGNHQALSEQYFSLNKTSELYIKCVSDLATASAQKDPLQVEVDTLKKEQEDSKNTKYLWAAVAAGLAFAGTMYFTGRWGNRKIKHPEDSYNRNQAG